MMQRIAHNSYFRTIFQAFLFATLSFGIALGSNEGVEAFRQKRLLNRGQMFLEEGRQELDRGSFVRAIRVLSQAISKGADPEAFKLRGQAYESIGEPEKALSDFSSYVAARGSEPEAYVLRGDAYNCHHDSEMALADFTRAIDLGSSSADTFVGRGIAYLGLEEFELAIKEFRMALQYDPGDTDALTDLGLAYMLANKPEEAVTLFEKALAVERDPKWKMRLAAWMRDAQPGALVGGAAESPSLNRTASWEKGRAPEEVSAETGPKTLRQMRHSIARLPSSSTSLPGTWRGRYQGYDLSMQLQQSGRNLTGVLRVRPPAGPENSFNFVGTFENGKIVVSHHGGTSFSGRLADEHRLVGVLSTADGLKIPVDLSDGP